MHECAQHFDPASFEALQQEREEEARPVPSADLFLCAEPCALPTLHGALRAPLRGGARATYAALQVPRSANRAVRAAKTRSRSPIAAPPSAARWQQCRTSAACRARRARRPLCTRDESHTCFVGRGGHFDACAVLHAIMQCLNSILNVLQCVVGPAHSTSRHGQPLLSFEAAPDAVIYAVDSTALQHRQHSRDCCDHRMVI